MEKKMTTKSKVALAVGTLIVCIAAFIGLNYTLGTASSEPFYLDDSSPGQAYPEVKSYILDNIDPDIVAKAGEIRLDLSILGRTYLLRVPLYTEDCPCWPDIIHEDTIVG